MTLATAGITPVTQNPSNLLNFASGTYTGDGSASAQLNIDWTPKYVKLIDLTDVFSWEWVQGMPANDTIYFTGSADMAIDTNNVISTNGKLNSVSSAGVYSPAGNGPGDGTLINTSLTVWGPDPTNPNNCTIGANGLVNGKSYVWFAFG